MILTPIKNLRTFFDNKDLNVRTFLSLVTVAQQSNTVLHSRSDGGRLTFVVLDASMMRSVECAETETEQVAVVGAVS